jgi:hypothetical protein
MTTTKTAGIDANRHPTLARLVADGTVWVENGEYVGEAAGGVVVVTVGVVGDEDTAEAGLYANPDPRDW